jgi:parallel beta-helix repeat protein
MWHPSSVSKRRTFRPQIEVLEARALPSTGIGSWIDPPSMAVPGTIIVPPGGSIQKAVDKAVPGDVIVIEPGVYNQTVVVATPALTIVGLTSSKAQGVVIRNPGKAANGITVAPTAAGFTLQDVAVKDFSLNGVLLTGVIGFHLNHVTATDDGEYGLFPVFCSHGVIEDCQASGHKDTGIYVGQSQDVTIRGNTTFGNVNGIEIENSTGVQAIKNESYSNSAGILVDLLPFLRIHVATNNLVQDNNIHDNNKPNHIVLGQLQSLVPAGTGILVLGADNTTVQGNTVTANNTMGIGVISSLAFSHIGHIIIPHLVSPNGTQVTNNDLVENGNDPALPFLRGADLVWDGLGNDNCWMGNVYETILSPIPLPTCSFANERSSMPPFVTWEWDNT